jgi:anti-anti-sigma factor
MLRLDPLTPTTRRDALASYVPRVKAAEPADAAPQVDRRLERWIARLLDGDDAQAGRDREAVLGALAGLAWRTQAGRVMRVEPASNEGRARVQVTRDGRGVQVVRLLDASLVREDELAELAERLECLVLAGPRRVLLDFTAVERLSSQVVALVAGLHKLCAMADGGHLALCGVRPELRDLFRLTGLEDTVPIHPDRRAALEASWPERGPGILPVGVLAALRRERPAVAEDDALAADGDAEGASAAREGEPAARLVIQSGPGRGRWVRLDEAPLVIGRDPSCAVRSSYPGLSRFHARIERRGRSVLVRDLGSTNGTRLDGQLLRDAAAEARDGSTLHIGPLRFGIALDCPEPADPAVADEMIVDWLRDPESDDEGPAEPPPNEVTQTELPRLGEDVDVGDAVRATVVEDVLIITPLRPNLAGDAALDALREALHELSERPLPRRVVIDLVRVGELGSAAVGVLLAHALRLDQAGGVLRLARPNPRVRALLEHVRLPELVEMFDTLDDAVLSRWPS